jgi:hypothetical protein
LRLKHQQFTAMLGRVQRQVALTADTKHGGFKLDGGGYLC